MKIEQKKKCFLVCKVVKIATCMFPIISDGVIGVNLIDFFSFHFDWSWFSWWTCKPAIVFNLSKYKYINEKMVDYAKMKNRQITNALMV